MALMQLVAKTAQLPGLGIRFLDLVLLFVKHGKIGQQCWFVSLPFPSLCMILQPLLSLPLQRGSKLPLRQNPPFVNSFLAGCILMQLTLVLIMTVKPAGMAYGAAA